MTVDQESSGLLKLLMLINVEFHFGLATKRHLKKKRRSRICLALAGGVAAACSSLQATTRAAESLALAAGQQPPDGAAPTPSECRGRGSGSS